MPDKIVHKTAVLPRVQPVPLIEIVLCTKNGFNINAEDLISQNINQVSCANCWALWRDGIYE